MVTEEHRAFAHLWQLFGYTLIDDRGNSVGIVDRVWADNTNNTLKFLGLQTGLLRRQTHVVPAGDSEIDDLARSIRVRYPLDGMQTAPCHNTDIAMSSDLERAVYSHYDSVRSAPQK